MARKLTPIDPPMAVDAKDIGKSRAVLRSGAAATSAKADLVFGTYRVEAQPLREKPTPSGDLLWSMGHPAEVAPSQAVWGRGKWELTIAFTISNLTDKTVSIHDIRAHMYYVSGIEIPLLMVIHRARIELTQDNSIFSDGRGFVSSVVT